MPALSFPSDSRIYNLDENPSNISDAILCASYQNMPAKITASVLGDAVNSSLLGRIEDLEESVGVLQGRKAAPGVNLFRLGNSSGTSAFTVYAGSYGVSRDGEVIYEVSEDVSVGINDADVWKHPKTSTSWCKVWVGKKEGETVYRVCYINTPPDDIDNMLLIGAFPIEVSGEIPLFQNCDGIFDGHIYCPGAPYTLTINNNSSASASGNLPQGRGFRATWALSTGNRCPESSGVNYDAFGNGVGCQGLSYSGTFPAMYWEVTTSDFFSTGIELYNNTGAQKVIYAWPKRLFIPKMIQDI